MSEEVETNDGTMSGLKKTIIGFASTAVLTVGGFFMTKLTGGDEPAPVQQVAPVININNTQTQSAGGGKTIIIKEKATEAKAVAQPKPKKKDGDEFKEEAPKW